MKKRLLAFLAVTLSVLFVLPIASPIVTFAANALPRDEAQYVVAERNVALNKPVTVTEGRYIDNTDWYPAGVVDGLEDCGLHLQAAPDVYDHEITEENAVDVTINLKGTYTIKSVRLKTPSPSYNWGSLPYGWILQVSNDGGDTFQDAVNVTSGNAYDSQVDVPAEFSAATHVRIHIYDDSNAAGRVGVNFTAIGEIEVMGTAYDAWTNTPSYVDNNASALDTREGTLSYTPSADGKTVTISYYDPSAQETKSYVVPNNNNYLFGGFGGVDDLGRELSEAGENGVVALDGDQEKYVGIFYFLWHGMHDGANAEIGKAWNLQAALEANGGYKYGTVGTEWDMHWFAEPLYGYYHGNDTYVYRKHVELLMNAGVDFLYFDITNNFSYTDRALTLMSILQEYSDQGYDVPQVLFYTNTDSLKRVREIYNDIYSQNLYPDTWFRIDGKPVVVAHPSTLDQLASETQANAPTVGEFFTVKQTQWPNNSQDDVLPGNMTQTNNSWPWIDFHWPQRVYTTAEGTDGAINVSIAQHSATTDFSDSATKNGNRYYYNRGRSFQSNGTTTNNISYSALDTKYNSNAKTQWTNWSNDWNRSNYGYNFQEQFDYALKQTNVKYILVTGWNEWVATNCGNATSPEFIDAASVEFSRDIEMTKGYYFDNYYMQLVSNIQKAKGTAPYIIQDQRYPINVTGSFDQWDKIALTYTDPMGDASYRNHIGYGETGFQTYTNETGRNDIVASKITSDTKNVYFYIQTAEAISYYSNDAWMQIYVDVDRNASTGWYGYDYIINYAAQGEFTTTVAKYTGTNGAYKFEALADTVSYQVKNNKMMIAVPLAQLGISNYNAVNFEFKVLDAKNSDMTTMESFYTDGDVAPLGRLNYIYHGRTTDALDPVKNNAVADVIPEPEKPVEYTKTEGYLQLWGTENTTSGNRHALTTNEATSVGVRLTVPADIVITDFSTQFTGITDRPDITLRVYRWNNSQADTVKGVVVYEETKQYMPTTGGDATVVVNLPAAGSNAITNGEYFFVWTSASGKTQAAQLATSLNNVVSGLSTYANGSQIGTGYSAKSKNVRAAISYLKTTDTVATPVDTSKYTQVSNQKAHVILLAGQSNASGSTPITDLRLHESTNAARYDSGFSNVKIMYWNDYGTTYSPDGNSSGGQFVDVKTGQGANANCFGIEIGLAEYLSETYPGETFYLIKSAIGGSMLTSNKADSSASYWLNNGTTEGRAYTVFKNCVLNGLAALEAQGLDPEVVAFMWMQGESDATVAANAKNYLSNMNKFNTQLQDMIPDQYEATNGIAILDSAIATNACWQFSSQVNAAKRQFAEQNQNYYYLDTTNLVATADAAHYGASDMIKLGRAFGAGVDTVLKNAHYVAKAPDAAVEATRHNVALGKGVAGDGWANNDWDAPGLTDGIYGEYAYSASGGGVRNGPLFNNAASGMIMVWLGENCLIDQIDLYAWTWRDFAGTSTFPSAYTIEIGDANGNWTTVVSDSGITNWQVENGAKTYVLETPVVGDRVRFNLLGVSGRGDFTGLGEMVVWGTETNPTRFENAALNKGALVQPETNTLNQGPSFATWDPARLTDGALSTNGAGLYLTNTPDGTYVSAPQSSTDILVNLQDAYDLYYFELYPQQYSPEWIPQGYGLPRAYTIYTSMDAINWTEAVSVDGNAEGVDPYTIEWGKQTLYLESAVRAKYVKITITDYGYLHYDGDNVADWAGIGEFVAMGMPAYVAPNTIPSGAMNVAQGGTVNAYGTTLNWDGSEWNDQRMVNGVITSAAIGEGLFFVGGTPGAEYGSAPDGNRTVDIKLNGTYEVYGYDLYAMQFNGTYNLGYTYPTAYTIYTSADGGATWEPAYGFIDSTDKIWVPYHSGAFAEAKLATDIRIVFTHWSGNVECPVPQGIGEFILYGKDLNGAGNVALGKPYTFTGGGATWGAVGDGWGDMYVNDGLTVSNTGASSGLMYDNTGDYSGTAGSAVGATFVIDLQGSYEISEYILWQGMVGTSGLLPQGYTFSISTDNGVSFQDVDVVTNAAVTPTSFSHKLSQTYSGVTHVRLKITQDSGIGITLLGELEVIGVLQKSANVGTPDLTNKLTINSINANNTANDDAYLTDGNTTANSWMNATAASGLNPVIITADLGIVYEVDSVLLYTASATSTLPRNFHVEVSFNGIDWTTVASYMGVAATNSQGQAFTAKFTRTYAQYVRVVITGDSGAGYSEISEIAICGSAHNLHVYTEQATAERNLKTAATCSAQAVYYVSCPCGANHESKTFAAGGFAAHNYVKAENATKLQDANCSTADIYAKQCEFCGKLGGGVFAKGETVDHSFTAEEAHSNYLVSDKTCADYAIYYCSCATCNTKGTETFEYTAGGKLPHEHDEGVYDKTTGERTYYCGACEQYRAVGVEFSMSVTLGTNLDVNYFATVDAEATNPVLNVQVPGQDKLNASIAGVLYSTTADGRNIYKFTYTDVGPQNVGTTVNLSLNCDEYTVHQKAHAVESYLTDLKTDADATVVAAADALLVYSNAAKRVVTADSSIAVDVSNYVNVESTDKAVSNNGVFATFKSATVWFDSANRIRYTVALADGVNAADLTFKVSVNGGAETVVTEDCITIVGNTAYIYTEAIEAAHFDDKYTVTVYNGDEAGASASYSVKSYAYTMQNAEESNQVILAKALYLYGLSAKALAQ